MLKRFGTVKSKKWNNQGMTLVEVLIAMTILGILVTPTLKMFATSSGTNLRAKYRQRATTVGESVMDSFKAYSVEDLCEQFRLHSFTGVDGTVNMEVKAYHDAPTVADPNGLSAAYSAQLTNHKLNTDADLYRFTIRGAKAEGSSYDIQIDARPRAGVSYGEQSLGFEGIDKYSDAIINLQENIVRSENGELQIFGVLSDLRGQAQTSFAAYHSSLCTFEEATIKDLKRTIDITVDDTVVDAASGKRAQTVQMAVTYTCKVTVKYSEKDAVTGAVTSGKVWPAAGATEPEYTYKVEYEPTATGDAKYLRSIYDNTNTLAGENVNGRVCKLNNLYLYYFPVNKEVYGTGCNDEINITANLSTALYDYDSATETDPEGKGLLPLNLVIVRQKPTTLTETQIVNTDPNYDYKVTVTASAGKVNLYHNFNQPLITSTDYDPKYPLGLITGNINNSSEVFDTAVTTGKTVNLLKTFMTDDVNLIYDLDVKVFEDTTAGFDQGNLLAEFTGSKND